MPRPVWTALLLGACSFAPLDVEGRMCARDGLCPSGLTCVHGACVKSMSAGLSPLPEVDVPDAGTSPTEPDAGSPSVSPDGGSVAVADGGRTDGGRIDGGAVGGGGADGGDVTQSFPITANSDDATWCDPNLGGGLPIDEIVSANPFFDLSYDEGMCHIGLRFVVSVPKGAVIRSAKLRLHRIDGQDTAGKNMTVRAFDNSGVQGFADNHVHSPIVHCGNLSNLAVGGFSLSNANGATITSPDLAAIVQEVINRADWAPGRAVTLLLLPELSGYYWVRFEDSQYGGGAPPTLELTWRP